MEKKPLKNLEPSAVGLLFVLIARRRIGYSPHMGWVLAT